MVHPESERDVRIERDVPAAMRDGTILRSDVYRPEGADPLPVLLLRTPYGKFNTEIQKRARGLAAREYVVVVQDCRGRYTSDGLFYPFYSYDTTDDVDGYDTVEWAAALPGSNGRVGTYGGSYTGWTQWRLLPTRPPHLVCAFYYGCVANLRDREVSGILRTGRVVYWVMNTLAPDARRRAGAPTGPYLPDDAAAEWETVGWGKWFWFLPWKDVPVAELGDERLAHYFYEWCEHHTEDYFGFAERHPDVDVPVLHLTGYYDQQVGTVNQFLGMVKNGRTEQTRRNQRLVIGPWSHGAVTQDGEIDFGAAADLDMVDQIATWSDRWLKGNQPGSANDPTVRYFTMGENAWHTAGAWPPAETRPVTFFLHSQDAANTAFGDGSLALEPPAAAPADRLVYDPRDPVPTLYGKNTQDRAMDHRRHNARRDILVFQTPPLTRGVRIAGNPVVTLWAASSARDTDFTARLIDVFPDGTALAICHGIVRARYRDGLNRPSLLEPGRTYEYTIELQPTSNLFLPGHRVRLDVSSSDFPNFDRNHNTGGDDWAETTLVTATQEVFHDSEHPSRLTLPVIE